MAGFSCRRLLESVDEPKKKLRKYHRNCENLESFEERPIEKK
jgi:hypothetical protein